MTSLFNIRPGRYIDTYDTIDSKYVSIHVQSAIESIVTPTLRAHAQS